MARFVNIPSTNADPFYRYKMPVLIVRKEKGKTLLVNIGDVAKSLDRPTRQLMKYMGKHCACGVHNETLQGRSRCSRAIPVDRHFYRGLYSL